MLVKGATDVFCSVFHNHHRFTNIFLCNSGSIMRMPWNLVHPFSPLLLNHWGRETHICVNELTIIGPDNGLSPGRRQAIIWTSAGILLIKTLGISFGEILREIRTFLFKNPHLKISPSKWHNFSAASMCWQATTIHPPRLENKNQYSRQWSTTPPSSWQWRPVSCPIYPAHFMQIYLQGISSCCIQINGGDHTTFATDRGNTKVKLLI